MAAHYSQSALVARHFGVNGLGTRLTATEQESHTTHTGEPLTRVHHTHNSKLAVTDNTHLHGLQVVLILAEVHNKEKGHWQLHIPLQGVLDG